MERPIRVGITQGDVNGVGCEIILKAIGEDGITELFTPVIFGVSSVIQHAKDTFGYSDLKIHEVADASEVKDGKVNLVCLTEGTLELHPGEVRKDSGASAVESLERAVESLRKGDIDVLVTAPISKEAVQSDSFKFPGHTEFLSERIGEGEEALMILCNDNLRVALLTKHLPVAKIAENITEENVIEVVEKLATVLKKDFGIIRPKVAVLSLNPHAGDGGLLGSEEEDILQPAISKLRDKGILAFGPFASDGFFGHESYRKFDGVLAMYHDQGLAPFKTIASSGGVNFSANLPYVRTSPDHGTAYDSAWKGEADASSMKEAIYMAIDIFRRRKLYDEVSANPLKKYVHERPEKSERFERNAANETKNEKIE